MVRVKCQSCGFEFDCDVNKDPYCICPRCNAINPINLQPQPASQGNVAPPVPTPPSGSSAQQATPQAAPTPTASPVAASQAPSYAVVYAVLSDGTKKEVARLANDGSEVVLGRNELAQFALRDPMTISRVHLKVKMINKKIYIRDDSSTNGTYIDGNDIRGKGYIEVPPGKEVHLVNPRNPASKLVFEVK